jgi:hypothetical protein
MAICQRQIAGDERRQREILDGVSSYAGESGPRRAVGGSDRRPTLSRRCVSRGQAGPDSSASPGRRGPGWPPSQVSETPPEAQLPDERRRPRPAEIQPSLATGLAVSVSRRRRGWNRRRAGRPGSGPAARATESGARPCHRARNGTKDPEKELMIGDQGCDLVPPVGIEPTTHGLGNRCSIP